MKNFKRTALTVALITGISMPVLSKQGDNAWEKQAKDAWIDGKAEATLLFNGNLNSFDINTDVIDGEVTLTGKVESNVDRELAEELVMGIDGVTEVNNELTVMSEMDDDDEMSSEFTDAKIVTVVKSRFLFDSEISGTNINVDVENRVVTLNGTVESEAERDLAATIAKNTNDVKEVKNMLKVEKPAS